MSEPLLTARGLRCHFRRGQEHLAAVDGVDLTIEPGEVWGLVGESGSGKSTLGRVLVGLQARNGGSLKVNGISRRIVASHSEYRRLASTVQMIFQDSYSSLDPRMTILQSLVEPMRAIGVSADRAEVSAKQWLDRVGLPEAAAWRYPHELSGGQRQRIGIARAFSVDPSLVVCDEAVSALDVSIQAQILALLQDIQREKGTAMLFISHDLAVVRHLSDRVAVMYQGEIVEQGDCEGVYRSPTHPYTRALLSLHLDADAIIEIAPALPDVDAGNLIASIPLATDIGCRYAARCAHAQAACREVPPWLRQAEHGGLVACHRLEELESAS